MPAKPCLVLGGGGSRGIAHIGVIDVLKRENVPVDFIVGTSMGAIVGAMYAAGYQIDDMTAMLERFQKINAPGVSVLTAKGRQKRFAEELETMLGGRTFEDLHIPLVVTAVDIISGQEIALSSGDLVTALLASSALPAIFLPVEIDDMQLLDGGVIDSVATRVAYDHGYGTPEKPIIAVDVYPPLSSEDPWMDPVSLLAAGMPFGGALLRSPAMLSVLWRSFRILAWQMHHVRLTQHPPQILLRPELGNASLDFNDLQSPYYAGMQEAERHLDAIRALLRGESGHTARSA